MSTWYIIAVSAGTSIIVNLILNIPIRIKETPKTLKRRKYD